MATRFDAQASEELELEPDSEKSTQYFLLNTNKVNDVDDHKFMLEKQVAAAFEDGYKEKIEKFKKGDWVFLYESGQGIVAFGQASGKLEKAPHYGRENKTYYQHLEGFTPLSKAIKASEVKKNFEPCLSFCTNISAYYRRRKTIVSSKKTIQVNYDML